MTIQDAWEKMVLIIYAMQTKRAQIRLSIAQSDLSFLCLLTDLLDTVIFSNAYLE